MALYISPFLVFFSTLLVAATYGRKLKYFADYEAGELLGTPLVLAVLTKIADIVSPDGAQTKKSGDHLFAYFPTLQQRIRSLEASQTTLHSRN